MATPKPRTELSVYLSKPEIVGRFLEIFPNEQLARSYINSVLILVAEDEKLQACTPKSIFVSSLRAAALGLSCDKSLKQAWLVPYSKNIGTRDNPEWVQEAQFQPHYLGLYHLAMRTGKYRVINVSPVYEGTQVLEDPLTGKLLLKEGNLIYMPANPNASYRDITTRRRGDMTVIGWIAYFMSTKGAEKSEYMSIAEIDDHARKYVKGYLDEKTGKVKNPNWADVEKRAVMEMKTVFKKLTKWMDLSGEEGRKLKDALLEPDEIIDAPEMNESKVDEPKIEPIAMNIEQARNITVNFGGETKALGILIADNLNKVYLDENTDEITKEAVRLVLSTDFQLDVPEKKLDREKTIKELL